MLKKTSCYTPEKGIKQIHAPTHQTIYFFSCPPLDGFFLQLSLFQPQPFPPIVKRTNYYQKAITPKHL